MPGVADRHPDTPIIPVTVGCDATDVSFTKLLVGVTCLFVIGYLSVGK